MVGSKLGFLGLYSYGKYLLSAYYVPSIVLGVGVRTALRELTVGKPKCLKQSLHTSINCEEYEGEPGQEALSEEMAFEWSSGGGVGVASGSFRKAGAPGGLSKQMWIRSFSVFHHLL